MRANKRRLFRACVGALFIGAMASAQVAVAGAGGLDTTFGTGGRAGADMGSIHETAYGVAIQSDGKIVVAGETNGGYASGWDFAVARFNANGTLDTGFSGDGKDTLDFGWDEAAIGVAIQGDGKIVVAGITGPGGSRDFELVRYNTDGSLDNTFSGDGKVQANIFGDDYVSAVAIQPDGKILVAGTSEIFSGAYTFSLARFNANGTLDTSFGPDYNELPGAVAANFTSSDTGSGIALQPDGKIIVVGSTRGQVPDEAKFGVARFNVNGSLDSSFDGDGLLGIDTGPGYDGAWSGAVQPDGKIVVGGWTTQGTNLDVTLVRLDSTGALDTSFDSDGKVHTSITSSDDLALTVLLQPDGKIIAGSASAQLDSYAVSMVRYNPDGSLDTSFSSDGMFVDSWTVDPWAYALQADGNIVVAGTDPYFGADFAVARYLGSPPAHQPDMKVQLVSAPSYKGEDTYNLTGLWQTVAKKVAAGKKVLVDLQIQNDSNSTEGISLKGCGSGSGFVVAYTYLGTPVTAEVTGAGWVSPDLAPEGTADLSMSVKVKSRVKSGKKLTCSITGASAGDPLAQDRVKVRVTVK